MREKFVIYRRQPLPKSEALPKAKKFAAVCVLGMLGVVGMHFLYAPATGTPRAEPQQQTSDALKQLLPQTAAPMSVALAANVPPAPAIENEPATGNLARSENRTEMAEPPQSSETAAQPAAEQRPVKTEKSAAPKQKVARTQRNNQFNAYAQTTYQDPYRANAARWAFSPQRPSGFFPF